METQNIPPEQKPNQTAQSNQTSQPEPAPNNNQRKRQGGWLASLLSLVAILVAAWVFMQMTGLRSTINVLQSEFEDVARWEAELPALTGRLDELEYEIEAIAEQLEQVGDNVQDRLRALRQTMTPATHDWVLLEIEYLLRLANQRLQFVGDVPTTIALLKSADDLIRELDDPSLLPVREALAEDITALEILPTIDREGLILDLIALSKQIPELPLNQRVYNGGEDNRQDTDGEVIALPVEEVEDLIDHAIWEQAWQQLKEVIIIRRHPEPAQTYGLPADPNTVHQSLFLMLEQAQWAVLQADSLLYEMSLEKAFAFVTAYSSPDQSATQAFLEQLQILQAAPIELPLPDISDAFLTLQQQTQS